MGSVKRKAKQKCIGSRGADVKWGLQVGFAHLTRPLKPCSLSILDILETS